MAERRTIVIVGGGLAGATAAATLRQDGFDGHVVLVGAEPEVPYERPPLSKGYLTGDSAREEARVHPEAFYAEHDIELLTGTRAIGIHLAARRVELTNGATPAYDQLLLATGAVPRRPPIPGADLDGVLVLRTLADADALQAAIRGGGAVAIVGAGWIGCEVAAAARTLGADVTLIEQAGTPLERVLGPELGAFFADLHREHGVDLRTGAQIARITGAGRVDGIELADGTRVACDTVLMGVGVAPATELAEQAGLPVANGIVVDDRLRTADPRVFAAGDVACAEHPRYGARVRVEHWANAGEQGGVVARAMLGRDASWTAVPFFFSDQYDVGLEYWGLHGSGDRLIVRRHEDERRFQALWVDHGGRVTAAMHANDWDASEALGRLVEDGAPIDVEAADDAAMPVEPLHDPAGAAPQG